MERREGPFIQIACFCEMTIEDKQGVLSLIRIIDTVNHQIMGRSPPQNMQPFDYPLKLVLTLKSGKAKGRYEVSIVPELPSRIKDSAANISAHLGGEERGTNMIIDFRYRFTQEGLYWIHIYLEDDHLTSIPFSVKYSRVETGPIS